MDMSDTVAGDTPQHIVMRFADSMCGGVDTIGEHRKVIAEQGAVWIAKLGKPLAGQKISLLGEQINRGTPTYLFLVRRKGAAYEWVKARLVALNRRLPQKEACLTPSYYRPAGVMENAGTWLKVTKLMKPEPGEIAKLHVSSSGRQIIDTLKGSMAAMFLVTFGRSAHSSQLTSKEIKQSFEDAVLDVFEEDEDQDHW